MAGLSLGFIGFGEVVTNFSLGLRRRFEGPIRAYDLPAADPAAQEERARRAGLTLESRLDELVGKSDLIICAANTTAALPIAREAAESLRPGQIYADFNSASPMLKEQLAAAVEPSGALFVDGAILGIVAKLGFETPAALSGPGAAAFQEIMEPLGMSLTCLSSKPGQASALKMVRSVFQKGLAVLLLETMAAGASYGVVEEVFASIDNSFKGKTIAGEAALQVPRAVVHASRRVGEMDGVLETLAASGTRSAVSRAVRDAFGLLAELGSEAAGRLTGAEDFADLAREVRTIWSDCGKG